MGSSHDKTRSVRGDRGDGQGVRQPAPARAARPARPGAAHGRGARAGERAVRPPTPPSTCRRCTRRAWSHARARARACATRSPATTRCACGSRCATPRPRAWPRSSGPRATTSARTSRRSVATSCVARLARGDVVLIDVRPGEEFEAGPHRRRPLDPDRRARAAPGGAARRPRGRRLLPRTVLRVRARGVRVYGRRGRTARRLDRGLARMAARGPAVDAASRVTRRS